MRIRSLIALGRKVVWWVGLAMTLRRLFPSAKRTRAEEKQRRKRLVAQRRSQDQTRQAAL
jgi:hypothetical protein